MENQTIPVNYLALYAYMKKTAADASMALDAALNRCEEVLLKASGKSFESQEDFDLELESNIMQLYTPTKSENPDVDYAKLYTGLFNRITDALDAISQCNYGQAKTILEQAQLNAEEQYMQTCDPSCTP